MKHAVRIPLLTFGLVATTFGCSVANDASPRGVEFARLAVLDSGTQASVAALDADEAEVSRALLSRDHEVYRIEIELDGDRFVAELDTLGTELVMHGEADGHSVSWAATSGEPMPPLFAQRWEQITRSWRASLVDDAGKLRPEFHAALNIPADLFAAPSADVPVAQTLWCPPPQEICFYDEVAAQEICFILAALCAPPPPCEFLGDCAPCRGFYCPPPCGGFKCDPCIGLWCEPTCGPFDPYCEPG
jgi:hypothetical protein